MPVNKKISEKNKAFKIIFFTFCGIVGLFSIYEFTIIGNPFFDPITPSILWVGILGITIGFAFRYIKSKKNK